METVELEIRRGRQGLDDNREPFANNVLIFGDFVVVCYSLVKHSFSHCIFCQYANIACPVSVNARTAVCVAACPHCHLHGNLQTGVQITVRRCPLKNSRTSVISKNLLPCDFHARFLPT